ncbi:hypothetical protein GW835_03985 [archaeon]|nr:hypothetical protein [archaeon]NCP79698.1 hypothetical protein [archaeon]NCP97988.1 hypothetical protein [archaeon]NCQ07464.1 hypothetical protein [archaeon]NCQ51255.1 hypothetical protein [archaeon]
MSTDLENLIPKREENTLKDIKEPNNKNYKAIVITVIFLIVIGFCTYGLIYVYKNYISGHYSNNQETDFLDNSKDCIPSNFENRQETTSLFMMYLSQDLNYNIKGLNEDDKCEVEIKTIDANVSFDYDDVLEYVNKEENLDAVYFQYMLLKSFDPDFDNSKLEGEITLEEKNQAKQEVIALINEEKEKPGYTPVNGAEKETAEMFIGSTEVCVFESLEGIDDFLSKKMTNSVFPNESSMSYKDDVSTSINIYGNVTCTTLN